MLSVQHYEIPQIFRLSCYQYELPPELIAQDPAPIRDRSRLLVMERATGRVSHHCFSDLSSLLSPSDVLVLNETKVVPAKLTGHKLTGGRVELLVLEPAGAIGTGNEALAVRVCMFRSSKPVTPGARIVLTENVTLTVLETVAPGRILVTFPVSEKHLPDFLELYGTPPLPPYVRSACRNRGRDRERYQTVYSKIAGSVAAPTAGLHFTPELLKEIERKGVIIARILLHVGPGTFTPVRDEDVRRHKMESEFYEIGQETAGVLNEARQEHRRIIAVGTTTVRALETALNSDGIFSAGRGRTELFITPGYAFRAIQGLVTNFHLPKTTLLMLACAFGGSDLVLGAYGEAVRERYRFYSFGDSCLII